MSVKSEYSVFEYLYRDGSNYKAWGGVLLRGVLSREEVDELVGKLDGKELFVAEQVGIPVLYEEVYQDSGGPTSDDHVFHEFHEIRKAEHDELHSFPLWGSADQLLSAFRAVKNWDLTLSPHWDI
jgi:hypothetical protein